MVLAVLVCVDHTRRWFHAVPADLRAFYAAGEVIDQHGNPFTVQPLFDFERSLPNGPNAQIIVSPVPLPPYDLAALGLLAKLPIAIAVGFMGLLTIGSGCVTAFVLHRVSRIPLTLAVAVSFLATVYSASGLGQIAPLAIAAIALATWAVRDQRFGLAGTAIAVSLIQPQIAVAPLLTLLIFVPRARIAALVVIALELLASLVFVGPALILQYLAVLSVHARAEIHFPAQLSLTWLLSYFGVTPNIAIALGSASTLVAIVAGIVIVARYRAAAVANGAVVALPAAFAVIGGSFLHEHQLALAIIPALLLLRPTKSLFDSSWAVATLVIPFSSFVTLEAYWPRTSAYPSIVLAFAVCFALVYARAQTFGSGIALRKAAIVTVGLGIVFLVLVKLRPVISFAQPTVIHIAAQNASIEWAIFCEAANAAFHVTDFALFVKIPIWCSVVAIAICSARNVEKPA